MPMAKGLSSGYLPISAVAMSRSHSRRVSEGGAARARLHVLGPSGCVRRGDREHRVDPARRHLVERVRDEIAPYFRKRLQAARRSASDGRRAARRRAARRLAAGEGQGARARSSRPRTTRRTSAATRLNNKLIMRAVGQSMVLSPPLIITRAQVDELVDEGRVGAGPDGERSSGVRVTFAATSAASGSACASLSCGVPTLTAGARWLDRGVSPWRKRRISSAHPSGSAVRDELVVAHRLRLERAQSSADFDQPAFGAVVRRDQHSS